MRRLALVTVVLSAAATGCADPSALTRPDPSALDGANFARPVLSSPVIDGVIRTGEYDGAAAVTFDVLLPDGRRTPVTVRFKHDTRYLYAAATIPRATGFHPSDALWLEFDNDNDGVLEDGNDIIGTSAGTPQNVAFIGADFHRYNHGVQNRGDENAGGSNETLAAWSASTTNVGTFELRHDLNSADDAHDFSIDPSKKAQSVGVQMFVQLEYDPVDSGLFTRNHYPSSTTYCQLTLSKKGTSIICP